jgi:sec-independent protein translocase protein TatA
MLNNIILGEIGWTELLIILLVVVILFGGKKIPDLMRGLGEGIREFKKASKGEDEPAKEKKE